jgi:hypothetical protein
MTALEFAIAKMDPEIKAGFLMWLAEKPQHVQELANQFPPRMQIIINGVAHWIIGYTETDDPTHAHLLVADVNPVTPDSHKLALERLVSVCPERLTVYTNPELN